MDTAKPRGTIIKNIYLYLVSFVALMMIIFSTADVLNIVLRTYIFTKADNQNFYYGPTCVPAPATGTSTKGVPDQNCLSKEEQDKQNQDQRSAQKQMSLVRDLSLILVAIPVFGYHWRIVRKKEENA